MSYKVRMFDKLIEDELARRKVKQPGKVEEERTTFDPSMRYKGRQF